MIHWNIQTIDSCLSTNALLKEWILQDKARPGTVLLTRNQTQGRGRFQREWCSPEGNLCVSLAVSAHHVPDKAYLFNLLTALALSATIRLLYGLDTQIKWPNDVLCHQKKIAGILSEVLLEKNVVIIGLGLNLNSQLTDFPEELHTKISTLFEQTHKKTEPGHFLQTFLNCFQAELVRLWEHGQQEIINDIQTQLAGTGQTVTVFEREKIVCTGILKGLNAEGFLLIETSDGLLVPVLAGDVSLTK